MCSRPAFYQPFLRFFPDDWQLVNVQFADVPDRDRRVDARAAAT